MLSRCKRQVPGPGLKPTETVEMIKTIKLIRSHSQHSAGSAAGHWSCNYLLTHFAADCDNDDCDNDDLSR